VDQFMERCIASIKPTAKEVPGSEWADRSFKNGCIRYGMSTELDNQSINHLQII
jgi:hypothetical protein